MSELSDGTAPTCDRWLALTPRQSLPTDGTGRVIEVEGCRFAVFAIDGAVHVVDDECPHEGASLGDGVVIDGDVTCPWHGWHFRLANGENTDGLAACVRVYRARVREDDVIEVNLTDARTDSAHSLSE